MKSATCRSRIAVHKSQRGRPARRQQTIARTTGSDNPSHERASQNPSPTSATPSPAPQTTPTRTGQRKTSQALL
ncbi:hypothetical protein XI07_28005 [Bradyrhizobium sp. CCBAU 11445]|nr:hypothetical protein [Bradyrhizobium sp. CCBAU 25360]MDA9485813.1 hypothetical protein [Bradyrhizobium sp. CCBAU 11445]